MSFALLHDSRSYSMKSVNKLEQNSVECHKNKSIVAGAPAAQRERKGNP